MSSEKNPPKLDEVVDVTAEVATSGVADEALADSAEADSGDDDAAAESASAASLDTGPGAVIDRQAVIDVVRGAVDPRGLKATEIVTQLRATAKTRHRVRRLLNELLDDGVIDRGPAKRYFFVTAATLAAAATGAVAADAPLTAQVLAKASVSVSNQTPVPAVSALPAGTVCGRIVVNPAGFGFVERDDGEETVFVAARYRGGAMDRDRVALHVWLGYRGPEGRVVQVLERGRAKVTGTLRVNGRAVVLDPDDPRVQGPVLLLDDPQKLLEPAQQGLAVVAEIVSYPSGADEVLQARVLRVLGPPDDPRTEVQKILECEDIATEFPAAVVAEAEQEPQAVRSEDLANRADLRGLPFLTIDPETARDFDDAVCIEDESAESQRTGVTRLWVAVADVSHYVRAGSALDKETEQRGCSVYLPDRAIPMLPHALSSGICSLNPDVERMAMVARLDINDKGTVVGEQFMAAVIRSRARMDYGGVAAALGGDLRGSRARYEPYLPTLRRLAELAARLRQLRLARGSLDFDLPEAQVVLAEDDPRRVQTVRKARAVPELKQAYGMIEDFMLAANEAAARYFSRRDLPTMWRVHAPPRLEPLERLSALAASFGFQLDPKAAQAPLVMRTFLSQIAGQRSERALSFLLLRSLKQAAYAVDNVGHFGLAAPEYLHFTSPIRRYPDLVVHRLMKHQLALEGQPAGQVDLAAPPSRDELMQWAKDASSRERRAMVVERSVVDMYRVFLMREHLGEHYEGTVSGVTAVGLFIEIEDPYVEGLIRTDSLDERFEFDDQLLRLYSTRSGRQFALGDRVRVQIDNVSVQRRKIDLSLVELLDAATPGLPLPATRNRHGEEPARHRFARAAGQRSDGPSFAPAAAGHRSGGRPGTAGGRRPSSSRRGPKR